MPKPLVFIVILAVLAFGGYVGYEKYVERYTVERDDTLVLSKVVTATFAKGSSLKVGTLSGTVQAAATDVRGFGLLNSDQVIKAPYSVDYFVDLSRLSLQNYIWNPKSRTLSIRVPEVTVAPANVDESKMMVRRRGLFITSAAFDAMSRISSTQAVKVAQAAASNPENLGKARDNARVALAALLRAPLNAAGIADVNIVVHFPTDGDRSNQRWDESRSLARVLEDAR
ncbi:DUF4230 domain-containing protein [Sphingomonas paeninsulae]|uniref:DUF4230 domain-containing protein n=1 Tax=Sphingomonas paeninsulae TaxID=2319844 RepID=A0A494TDM6_SPHPE|nr:DUF4230 domain-containing protein [Sphingomonas paeninsulae]AYJ87330.1 DUF4230 domain-containing protein [Sphingomonas paeninsulae]